MKRIVSVMAITIKNIYHLLIQNKKNFINNLLTFWNEDESFSIFIVVAKSKTDYWVIFMVLKEIQICFVKDRTPVLSSTLVSLDALDVLFLP